MSPEIPGYFGSLINIFSLKLLCPLQDQEMFLYPRLLCYSNSYMLAILQEYHCSLVFVLLDCWTNRNSDLYRNLWSLFHYNLFLEMSVITDTACEVQKSDNVTLVDRLQLYIPQSPAAYCFAVFVHFWEQNWNKTLFLRPMGPYSDMWNPVGTVVLLTLNITELGPWHSAFLCAELLSEKFIIVGHQQIITPVEQLRAVWKLVQWTSFLPLLEICFSLYFSSCSVTSCL